MGVARIAPVRRASSRDEAQARLYLDDCKHWAGIVDLAAKDLGEILIAAKKNLSARVLQFVTGRCRIRKLLLFSIFKSQEVQKN